MKGESLQMGRKNREVVQNVKVKMGKRFGETEEGKGRAGSQWLAGNKKISSLLIL